MNTEPIGRAIRVGSIEDLDETINRQAALITEAFTVVNELVEVLRMEAFEEEASICGPVPADRPSSVIENTTQALTAQCVRFNGLISRIRTIRECLQ